MAISTLAGPAVREPVVCLSLGRDLFAGPHGATCGTVAFGTDNAGGLCILLVAGVGTHLLGKAAIAGGTFAGKLLVFNWKGIGTVAGIGRHFIFKGVGIDALLLLFKLRFGALSLVFKEVCATVARRSAARVAAGELELEAPAPAGFFSLTGGSGARLAGRNLDFVALTFAGCAMHWHDGRKVCGTGKVSAGGSGGDRRECFSAPPLQVALTLVLLLTVFCFVFATATSSTAAGNDIAHSIQSSHALSMTDN